MVSLRFPSLHLIAVFAFACLLGLASAFSAARSDNLAVYWGQDSAGNQQKLSFYCQDDVIDIIPLAFLYIFFGEGGMPVIDFANVCGAGGRTFPGTQLADCSFMASDIKQCQAKGKVVTLSLGGGTSKVGFSSDEQASQFADNIWNMFLGGSSDVRPFGDAVLDGIDLDIESGSSAHYGTFVQRLRSLSAKSKKHYYITAAPQCPFPDADIGAALNSAVFDAVYVQFYNNFCETSSPSEFNFDVWDHWARNVSPNRKIKVYLGAPASNSAADEGYVKASTLIDVAKAAQKQYPSFGGVMLWDADQAYTNDRYDIMIKNALTGGSVRPSTQDPPSPPANDNPPRPLAATSTSFVPSASVSFIRDPLATARVKRPSAIQPTD